MDRHERFALLSHEAMNDRERGLPGRAQLHQGPVGIRSLRMPGGGVSKLMRVMQTNACSLSCGYCPTFCGGKVRRARDLRRLGIDVTRGAHFMALGGRRLASRPPAEQLRLFAQGGHLPAVVWKTAVPPCAYR